MDVTSLEQLLSAFPVELCKTGNIISLADPKTNKKTTNKQTNFLVQLRGREAGGLECSGQISLAVSH